jgi:serine/threonine-protein kinase
MPRIPGVPGVPDFGPSVPAPAQPGPAKLRSRGVIAIAAIGALGVAGVLGYAASRSGADGVKGPAVAPAVVPPSPAPARVDPPAPAIPAMPAIAKIRVGSDPPGATVKEDGVELCGSTPCDIVYKGSDADPTHDHALTLTKPGFRAEHAVVKGADGAITVRLSKEAQRFYPQPQAAPVPMPPQAAHPETAPAPTGYKTDLPY